MIVRRVGLDVVDVDDDPVVAHGDLLLAAARMLDDGGVFVARDLPGLREEPQVAVVREPRLVVDGDRRDANEREVERLVADEQRVGREFEDGRWPREAANVVLRVERDGRRRRDGRGLQHVPVGQQDGGRDEESGRVSLAAA